MIEEKMRNHAIAAGFALLTVLLGTGIPECSGEDADPYAITAPRDTVFLGDYTAVLFDYVDSAGHVTSVTNELAIYKNGVEKVVLREGGHSIENLCAFDSAILDNCKIRDINGDGIKEIMVAFFTGGANCCFGANLYTAGDSFRLVFRIEPNLRPFDLVDLEKDGVPEIAFRDETFAHWKDTYRVYLPLLIWKWDGEKYRLANFRFSDHVLQDYQKHDPCGDLWNTTIYLSYAGRLNEADSLFMHCWSDTSSDRDAEFKAFKKQLEDGPFWQQLLQSDW